MAVRELFKNNLTGLDFDSYLSDKPPFQGYSMDHTDLKRLKDGHVGGQVSLPLAWFLAGFPTESSDESQKFYVIVIPPFLSIGIRKFLI